MFFISLAFFVASVIALAVYGLNFGVDFKGGSILEVEFSEEVPSISEVQVLLMNALPSYEFSLNKAGERGLVIRSSELSEEAHQALLNALREKSLGQTLEEKRFNSVGPAIGKELRTKSFVAIGLVLAVIAIYMTFVFRKLSRTLSLLAMNISTLVALLHDIVIPMGVFAVLGHYFNVQISAVFVAAVLTILGYTVSDKVVIFDRVRENILRGAKNDLGEIVHKSVMQTLVRSINNTLTVVLSSAAIYLFGGESIRYFALALMMGIFLGAYSSIFVSSPLLVWWSDWTRFRK
ncbi:MAG: protein-export membrane protein SecF [Candidatus Yanofskybacteria bacterium RIFCSPHIGHO2_02_FULL_41_29]|uniref:Protein-export membrane protein SecF n=1 Tax=Candidatus Yanofskybacteria bacterium RIFCSPHIGHO2_01_FULL_41_53 TaxID=1802663 RepID=A0A1F8EHI7_9BACT|nr:MAG: protein-export membrane protein SecF [Candidatus Yanofskybacteria bacterium RIFCSPHIGHO2_01_FULL_41_53]OGN10516.1 MAG: protein-export membrane protein SecF [Candidatus Yanofskybacteria bacterium RIFCSPHIGHO2_02_FULL_41_29]OGN18912.1 MAG: protein-export membrane protein SecF [Candidatus Yanofskybacteria bacterium RIFCSPHIGHO2_12_FULL_41_9]OGN21503.1 MAG: protein-export membrane protein SecF [Candidatus Yanofskybacteria bacterium RIFCSPLOWO2_01_FULL_41_67]OGN28477.1 MAG: protein-export me